MQFNFIYAVVEDYTYALVELSTNEAEAKKCAQDVGGMVVTYKLTEKGIFKI